MSRRRPRRRPKVKKAETNDEQKDSAMAEGPARSGDGEIRDESALKKTRSSTASTEVG